VCNKENEVDVVEELKKELEIVGTVSLVFLVIMIPAMVVAYCYLRKAVNTYFPVTLTKEKWNIKFLFIVFIVTYFIRLFYSITQLVLGPIPGVKIDIGTQMLILYCLYIAWDIPCILSILAMHHMNFGHKEAGRTTSVETESLSSESEALLSYEDQSESEA